MFKMLQILQSSSSIEVLEGKHYLEIIKPNLVTHVIGNRSFFIHLINIFLKVGLKMIFPIDKDRNKTILLVKGTSGQLGLVLPNTPYSK